MEFLVDKIIARGTLVHFEEMYLNLRAMLENINTDY